MGKDYYQTLGVDKSADDDAIKKAYKKQVRNIIGRLGASSELTIPSQGSQMASRQKRRLRGCICKV